MNSGYGQCASEMVAAQRMNERAKLTVEAVYGCVTIGSEWKFFRLRGTALDVDQRQYAIAQLDKLLGIFLHAVGAHPDQPTD